MKNLFAGLAIMVMLAGCSNLPAVQKAETKLENLPRPMRPRQSLKPRPTIVLKPRRVTKQFPMV